MIVQSSNPWFAQISSHQSHYVECYNQQMFQKATNFLTKLQHNLTHKDGSDGWSQICGGVEGKAFQFTNPRLCLVGVRGRFGKLVHSLQFLFVDPQTGQFQSTPSIGGNGEGQDFALECPHGQWFTKIDAIQFQTNTGMKSDHFGGHGGTMHTIETKGKRICGVKGLHTHKDITQVCFGVTH